MQSATLQSNAGSTIDTNLPGSANSDSNSETPIMGGPVQESMRLSFSNQPVQVAQSIALPQNLQVQVSDDSGALITNQSLHVKLNIHSGPAGAKIYGLDPVTQTQNGVATFSNLSFNKAGVYQLIATVPGIGSRLSSEFEVVKPNGATYYVSANGNDDNDGQSITTAWATVDKINNSQFSPGDSVLFEGGQTFEGCLVIGNKINSTPQQPFTIGRYGSGRFTLKANCTKTDSNYDINKNKSAVRMDKVSGFVLQDCILKGNQRQMTDANTYGAAYGVLFINGGWGANKTVSYATIQRCDISGFYTPNATDAGGEIFFNTQGPTQHISIIDNVMHGPSKTEIEDNGIGVSGNAARGRLVDVVVEGNHIYNIPGRAGAGGGAIGNGIVLAGSNLLIQNNVVHDLGANTNTCGGPAGIWAVAAKNVTIQFNEAYRVRPKDLTKSGSGPNAGGCDWNGFDLDLDVTDSKLQYNYSHDNFGAGYLAYISGTWARNVIRYNISSGDSFSSSGGGALSVANWSNSNGSLNVYNNIFDSVLNHGYSYDSGGTVKLSGYVANNIFRAGVSGGLSRFTDTNGSVPSLEFLSNIYWSTLSDSSQSYFNWGGCGSGNVCSGLKAWQTKTNQDPMAIELLASDQPPVNISDQPVTCSVDQIINSQGHIGLSQCLDGHFQALMKNDNALSGVNLMSAPYNLEIGVQDFFGNPLNSSNSQSTIGVHAR